MRFADLRVGGADRRDLGDLVVALDGLGDALDGRGQGALGGVDAHLHLHRVGAGRHVLETAVDDRLGQDRGRGGAVAGDVLRLGGSFLEELRAHVLERILELDLPGDGHAVMGDRGAAVLLVQGDVASLGTERSADRVRQRVDAGLEMGTGVLVVGNELGHAASRPLAVTGPLRAP